MRSEEFNVVRKDVVSQASGVVLEIGFGSGYNLPFYKDVSKVYALEPSRELFALAKERMAEFHIPIELFFSGAEAIPLPDVSMDCVVSTWTLCSVNDIAKTLVEIRRVLKPDGRLLFVEHGQSPYKFLQIVQSLVTILTRHLRGNCHLDRNIEQMISEAGFVLKSIEKMPEVGRPLMYSYRGVATK